MARKDQRDNQKKTLEKSLKREIGTKDKVPDIIMACEDKVSSPTYFKKIISKLIQDKKITQDSFVIPPHNHTNPKGVLEDLLKYSDANKKTYKEFKHKWIVIDRDAQVTNKGGHTQEDFNSAISSAKSQDIQVAYSNDSFELWYLLHFDYINSHMYREKINAKIIKKLKLLYPNEFSNLNKNNIKKEKYVHIIFDILLTKQSKAIKNAKKLLNDHYPDKKENNNPSTTVHLLVELLNNDLKV